MVAAKKRKKLTGSEMSFNIINYALFGIFTLICIFPFYYLFINTISANDLSSKGLITFYPKNMHLSNYTQVFQLKGFLNAFGISIARTALGTSCTVFASAFLGYLFTKPMWGRKFWYRFVVITMYFNAGLIPWYITMMNLGLTNNFLAYILPAVVQPFNIILVKTYIESTPQSLQEAAQIDGAGHIRVFLSVVLPIIKPILATVAIFAAVSQWNSFTDTLLLVQNSKLYTLQYILYKYLTEATSVAQLIKSSPFAAESLVAMQTPTSVRMTVSVISILPIVLVYPAFQSYFVKGIMIGAVKG